MWCDQYSFLLGTYLQLRFPEKEWMIAYVNDHYFCLEKQDTYTGIIPYYDIMGQCKREVGWSSNEEWISRQWEKKHVIRTVKEHGEFIAAEGYDI